MAQTQAATVATQPIMKGWRSTGNSKRAIPATASVVAIASAVSGKQNAESAQPARPSSTSSSSTCSAASLDFTIHSTPYSLPYFLVPVTMADKVLDRQIMDDANELGYAHQKVLARLDAFLKSGRLSTDQIQQRRLLEYRRCLNDVVFAGAKGISYLATLGLLQQSSRFWSAAPALFPEGVSKVKNTIVDFVSANILTLSLYPSSLKRNTLISASCQLLHILSPQLPADTQQELVTVQRVISTLMR